MIQKSTGKPLIKTDESKVLGSFTTSSVTFSSYFNSVSDMPSSSYLVKTDFKALTRPSKNNFKTVINIYFSFQISQSFSGFSNTAYPSNYILVNLPCLTYS